MGLRGPRTLSSHSQGTRRKKKFCDSPHVSRLCNRTKKLGQCLWKCLAPQQVHGAPALGITQPLQEGLLLPFRVRPWHLRARALRGVAGPSFSLEDQYKGAWEHANQKTGTLVGTEIRVNESWPVFPLRGYVRMGLWASKCLLGTSLATHPTCGQHHCVPNHSHYPLKLCVQGSHAQPMSTSPVTCSFFNHSVLLFPLKYLLNPLSISIAWGNKNSILGTQGMISIGFI